MMRSTTISAPISRSSSKHRHHGIKSIIGSSHIGIGFAVVATIIAFGGTIVLAFLMLSSEQHKNHHSHTSLGLRQSVANIKNTAKQKHSPQQQQQQQQQQQRKQQHADVPSIKKKNISNTQGLLIHTSHGTIRIYFTAELSGPNSIQYIIDVLSSSSCVKDKGCICERCKFYRAEPNLLLQGIIADNVRVNNVLGPCPPTADTANNQHKQPINCPEHDPNCGCHGPIMTKGMVGWAGGSGGPDFFINTHDDPVQWWEHQHTVWGMIRDEESLGVVEHVYGLPAHMTSMRMLDEVIEFSLELF